jgi:hypothetical protein
MGTTEVREAVKGQRKLSKLFSKEQAGILRRARPGGLELDNLEVLGRSSC